MTDEPTASRRFFWRPTERLSSRWKPLHLSGDENCNRTIGLRLPGGVLFVCLNVPLRQRPCIECRTYFGGGPCSS